MDVGSYKLIIEDDEGRRSVVPVDLGEVSIGRLEGNTIRLKERNVSRRHARLVKENADVYAEDLGSFNGVWVNGDRIAGRRELYDGDLIKIGDFHLELRGDGLAPRTEDTTQRTHGAPDGEPEATQPGFRLGEAAEDAELAGLREIPPPAPRRLPSALERMSSLVTTDPLPIPTPPVASSLEVDGASLPGLRDNSTAIIRMDQVSDEGPALDRSGAVVTGPRGKLVCVSTQFAGREYELSRVEMTIGRTDENDICVPHRSVSRQHAKVAISARRFKIVDLGSANGTLVNDEEYAQTELKHGDLIELGHVKFRFVPPGETYQFSEDELLAIEAGGRGGTGRSGGGAGPVGLLMSSPPLLLGAIGLVIAIAVVVATVLLKRGPDEAAVEAVGADDALAQVELDEGEKGDADRLSGQARGALKDRQWKRALALATAALAIDPGHEAAASVARQAETEDKAQTNYQNAVTAIDKRDWSEAWNSLQEIGERAACRGQAETLLGQVRTALISERVSGARAAIKAEDWDQASELTDELAGLDPARAELEELREAVRQGRARTGSTAGTSTGARQAPVKPRSKSSRPRTPAKTKPAPNGAVVKPPPVQNLSAQELYLEGARSLHAKQYQKAVDSFNRCVVVDRKYSLCYRALGIAYARLGNASKAARYYRLYLKVNPDAPDADEVRKLLQPDNGAPR